MKITGKVHKRKKIIILTFQILIIVLFLAVWEILARRKIINTILFSSPSDVCKCLLDLYKKNKIFNHILITTYETSEHPFDSAYAEQLIHYYFGD